MAVAVVSAPRAPDEDPDAAASACAAAVLLCVSDADRRGRVAAEGRYGGDSAFGCPADFRGEDVYFYPLG